MNKFFARIALVLLVSISFSAVAQSAHTPVGDLNLSNSFGYSKGMLIYKPWVFGYEKTVDMGEQISTPSFKCSKLIDGTEHTVTVNVTAAFNPSLLWETEYHRLVAVYGALGTPKGNKDIVNKDDLKAGLITYLGQWQTFLCDSSTKKSVKELLVDPSIDATPSLAERIKADLRAPFEVKVQTIRVVLPDELLRKLAAKALEKPAPVPVPAVKKPKVTAPAPQNSCCCTTIAVFTPACANPVK